MTAPEVHMYGFMRYGRRLGGAILFGALLPAVGLAQAATPAKLDSAAKKDSALTHAAAGKRSRLGALGRSALSKASGAADKVEQTTGVSKETMAKAALAGTGVGAAAMLVKPDSASLTSNVAAAAGRSMLQKVKDARAGRSGAKVGSTPDASAMSMGAMPGGAMTAEQMAAYRRQMAAAQAGAMQANAMPGGSAEMQALQAEYMQLVVRAQGGDKDAMKQLTRFSQEWSASAMRLQGLPVAQQQGAYEAAMRDALTCATKGKSCRA